MPLFPLSFLPFSPPSPFLCFSLTLPPERYPLANVVFLPLLCIQLTFFPHVINITLPFTTHLERLFLPLYLSTSISLILHLILHFFVPFSFRSFLSTNHIKDYNYIISTSRNGHFSLLLFIPPFSLSFSFSRCLSIHMKVLLTG